MHPEGWGPRGRPLGAPGLVLQVPLMGHLLCEPLDAGNITGTVSLGWVSLGWFRRQRTAM